MSRRKALAAAVTVVAAATGASLAGGVVPPATAGPIKWLAVELGSHRFGRLRSPDAIVARAGADRIGFSDPMPGDSGCGDGPQGPRLFDVGPDGSIWLLDDINHRLVQWRPAETATARTVSLPQRLAVHVFAVGSNGLIYAYAADLRNGHESLYALSSRGSVRWAAPVKSNEPLYMFRASNGVLYGAQPHTFVPLTTSDGQPLSTAEQRRRASAYQPLADGVRLLTTQPSAREVHVAEVDSAGNVLRAWRITSTTSLGLTRVAAALVGDDLVVPLDVYRTVGGKPLFERVVLRLRPSGSWRQFALDARAVWGDDGTSTPLRFGPDGSLYQLRTNPKTGVGIARFDIGSGS